MHHEAHDCENEAASFYLTQLKTNVYTVKTILPLPVFFNLTQMEPYDYLVKTELSLPFVFNLTQLEPIDYIVKTELSLPLFSNLSQLEPIDYEVKTIVTLPSALVAMIPIPVENLKKTFRYKKSAEEAGDVAYYIDATSWPADINLAQVVMTTGRKILDDFLRYLAFRITGAANLLRLIKNVEELTNLCDQKGKDAWSQISGKLLYGGKSIFEQLQGKREISTGTGQIVPFPFEVGDTINFNFTLNPCNRHFQKTYDIQLVAT